MNIDTEYSKSIFDIWIDGMENMKVESEARFPSNAGSSPEIPKVNLKLR